MANSKILSNSKRVKDDEYYTLYEDISNEVSRYSDQLRGKRIICPCDWDESYNEELVYKEEGITASDLFTNGTIKHLDIAASKDKFEKDFDAIKCKFVKFLVAHAETYGIRSISVSGYNPHTGQGVKFQDIDYSNYDLVITNPPYSVFHEFIRIMFDYHMQFLVIGPLLALTNSEIVKHLVRNELWLGYAKQLKGFERPDGTRLLSKDTGQGTGTPRASKWYTNLDVHYRHDRLILTENYDDSLYPHICNYDAIMVSHVNKIPYDYIGKMAVPVSFMQKFNPEQFEVIGSSSELAQPFYVDGKKMSGRFYTKLSDGTYKRHFDCLVIRNLNPRPIEE